MSDAENTQPQADAKTEETTPTPENGAQTVTETTDVASKIPAKTENENLPGKLGMLNNVSVTLTIEVGRTSLKIRDLLSLSKGSIIELDKMAGEPVDIYVNGRMIAQGNIITANGKYCVRLLTVKQNNPDSF